MERTGRLPFRPARCSWIRRPTMSDSGTRARISSRKAGGMVRPLSAQLCFDGGARRREIHLAGIFAPSARAITLPMSLIDAAPASAMAPAIAARFRRRIDLPGHEALDHRDLGLFLGDQIRRDCPGDTARSIRGAVSPSIAAATRFPGSPMPPALPDGRAAISLSLMAAVTMRKVETVAASRPRIASFSASLNCSRSIRFHPLFGGVSATIASPCA